MPLALRHAAFHAMRHARLRLRCCRYRYATLDATLLLHYYADANMFRLKRIISRHAAMIIAACAMPQRHATLDGRHDAAVEALRATALR